MRTHPRFDLLEVVRVASSEATVAVGEAGRRGAVLQIRQYLDGTYRYTLGYMVDGELGGLYREEDLEPTGERRRGPLEPIVGAYEGTSLRITEAGDVTGLESYVVLAEIANETS